MHDQRTNVAFRVHPEGLFEAWSNLYYRFALAMDAMDRGDTAQLSTLCCPDIHAGIEGVRWVENCVRSADNGAIWVDCTWESL